MQWGSGMKYLDYKLLVTSTLKIQMSGKILPLTVGQLFATEKVKGAPSFALGHESAAYRHKLSCAGERNKKNFKCSTYIAHINM